VLKKGSRPVAGDDGPRKLVGNTVTPSNPNRHHTASGRKVDNFLGLADVEGSTGDFLTEISRRWAAFSSRSFWEDMCAPWGAPKSEGRA
jgi:hypothetical protein